MCGEERAKHMAEKSSIEWTDATWNPVRGCTKISPGCKHCYAQVFAERFRGVPNHPYEQGFDLRLVPEKLEEPLRWKTSKRIFVNSMSDLFHPKVSAEYIAKVAEVMIQGSLAYLSGLDEAGRPDGGPAQYISCLCCIRTAYLVGVSASRTRSMEFHASHICKGRRRRFDSSR